MGDNNYVAWSDRLRAEGHEAGLKEGRKSGLEEGRKSGLEAGKKIMIINEITLICKKLKKNKDITQIADELESDIEHISEICNVAKKFAPDYDVDAIYAELYDENSSS